MARTRTKPMPAMTMAMTMTMTTIASPQPASHPLASTISTMPAHDWHRHHHHHHDLSPPAHTPTCMQPPPLPLPPPLSLHPCLPSCTNRLVMHALNHHHHSLSPHMHARTQPPPPPFLIAHTRPPAWIDKSCMHSTTTLQSHHPHSPSRMDQLVMYALDHHHHHHPFSSPTLALPHGLTSHARTRPPPFLTTHGRPPLSIDKSRMHLTTTTTPILALPHRSTRDRQVMNVRDHHHHHSCHACPCTPDPHVILLI